MTLTNLLRRPGPLAPLIATAVRRADRVVCVARMQRDFLARRLDFQAEQLPLVLSGTDAGFYDPEKAASNRRAAGLGGAGVVLAAGRDAGRDYRTLLQAAHDAPYQLRLVCSRANLNHLEIPTGVHVRYDIPQTVLRDEYAASDVVAIPTQGDASTRGSDCSGTLVLLDALAMRRPTVITNRSSVHDYITSGEHAIMVPPNDPSRLRHRLNELLSGDGSDAEAMAAAGQVRVRDHLTTRHFAARLAGVFQEVAASR